MIPNWNLRKIFRYTHPIIFILLFISVTLFFQKARISENKSTVASNNILKNDAKTQMPFLTEREKAKLSQYQCPDGMVAVLGGTIKTEWNFDKGKAKPTSGTPRAVDIFCMDIYEYPNIQHVLPQTRINFYESKKLCEAQGKRLCTEDEWELACAGEEARKYVYGVTRQPWICNTDGLDAGDCEGIAPSGSFAGCKNKFGIYDLNGNVSEWVDRLEYHGAVLRGGTGWIAEYGQSCFSRHIHSPDNNTYCDDGFRCCSQAAYVGSADKKQ